MQTLTESPVTPAEVTLPPRPPWLVRLHWLSVAILLLGVASVLLREGVEGRAVRGWLLEVHRWCGLSLLALVVVRVLLRLRWGRLPVVAQAARWLRAVASLTHGGLYALLAAIPLVGWALSSAADQPVTWFGLPLPALVAADEDLGDALADWHVWGAWALGALVLAHGGAALWHHLIRRDAVLRSMWPPWGRRSTRPE